MPPGTKFIAVAFSYNKDNRTVIDLGLRDPQGQRGWSGGNKDRFTVGNISATPSYRAGPIQPGEWKLILGIPNVRENQTATYEATITSAIRGRHGSIPTTSFLQIRQLS